MENFCESLREHSMKIINKKKMKLLTKEKQESNENVKICNFSKKNLKINISKKIIIRKVRYHGHYKNEYSGGAYSICN